MKKLGYKLMDKKPLVSVIVPIYNIASYLDKCIESICHQTYQNIQIILVNDGSTDYSASIITAWKEKDCRIEVVEKRNGGLVSARKVGIEKARGLYSIYIDGDDWIEADLVETLVNASCNLTMDIICAGHITDYGKEQQVVYNVVEAGTYAARNIVPVMLCHGGFYSFGITQYVWSKMFRTDMLRKVQLEIPNEISIGEDVAVTYNSILHADKLRVIRYAGYHYVQRNDSMCNVLSADEREKCEILITYLNDCFQKDIQREVLLKQLGKYETLLYLSRAIDVFDEKTEERILMPFGGIEKQAKVVLYGAGGVGKSVKAYFSRYSGIQVIGWVDREYQRYEGTDLDIQSPDTYDFENQEIDYIIVCVSSLRAVNSIREYLAQRVCDTRKICSLTEAFVQGDQ